MVKITNKRENLITICLMLVIVIVLILINYIFSNQQLTSNTDVDESKINKLVINEVMTSNKGAYADEKGNSYDWLELYNGSAKDIDLNGYGLSDEDSGKTKWLFPAVVIKSKEHLVVYLSGTTAKGLYANFSLNKAGKEKITLKNKSGKVIDAVETISLDKNMVMIRNNNGKWIESSEITPGYSNDDEGRQKFLKSRYAEDDVIITEILPSNQGNVSFDGNFYNYIEIQNTGKETVNLNEYYISNDSSRPFLYRLPKKNLGPNEVYLIYTSSLSKDNHASFDLKSKGGTVILTRKNKIIEEVEYKDLTNGFAYIKSNGDNFIEATNITPGYPNTPEGMQQFSSKMRRNPHDLIINEVMNANSSYLGQNGGEYYDWIELYNNSDQTIQLGDYYLTIDEDNKKMYNLPKKELKKGEYYVVMASGDTNLSNNSYQHANFKIGSSESIYLYKKNALVDSLFIANVPVGYSYGRGNENGFYYFEKPTPKSKNGNSNILEIAYEPTFSEKPGIYNDVKQLSVTLKGTGTIYYTLDGSKPTNQSKVYNSPIILTKTTVIRAISYENKKKASSVVTGTYIINEGHTLPVLSVSLPNASFNTITNRPDDTNLTVAAHAELYEKDKSFSIDCGLKLFGGSTRYIAKKSFALKFSSKYGPAHLKYKLFDHEEAVSYDDVVIRSGSQDADDAMMRDELATSIVHDYGTVDVQDYKAVVLYINGKYWGVYFLREKVDDNFVAHHYNVSPKGTNIVRIDNDVTVGSSNDYHKLVSYVRNHDLSNADNYKYVSSKLDIDNFIDFWIAELYTTNNDIVNTRFFNNPSVDNGKIKMIFYDIDYGFYNYGFNYLQWMVAGNGLGENHFDNSLLRGLMKNKDFKKRFIERLSYNLKNVWSQENILKRYQELVDLLKPEMQRNQKRWGGTYNSWQKDLNDLKNYLDKRRQYMINHAKLYFNLSSEEVKKYFG